MTTPKAKPLPTPGLLSVKLGISAKVFGFCLEAEDQREKWHSLASQNFYESTNTECFTPDEIEANAYLLKHSWNAIQSAAQRLTMRPDDLAEALADGGIAEMVEALRNLASIEDNTPDAYECADAFFDAGEVAKAILAKLPAAGKAGG